MDESLRSLQRAVRAAPHDRELGERLRAALLRQLPFDPAGAARELDDLQGVLATPLILGEHAPGLARGWRRVGPAPGATLLPPRAPERLEPAWEAPGRLRYLSAGLALLEEHDGALSARAPADGRVLWRVEGDRPGPAVEAWEDQEERATWLGWAAVPWGAAAISARWVAELEQRRVGRWTPRGRTTERTTVGRGPVHVEVDLQVLVGEGGRLGSTPPEQVLERAGPREALLDTIELRDWHEELLALSLDPQARQLAVRWRDEAEDWAVFLVLGDARTRATVGPAGSAPPPDDPFAPETARAEPVPATLGGDLSEAVFLPAQGGPLVCGRDRAGALVVRRAGPAGPGLRWAEAPLGELISGRKLRPGGPWGEGEAGLAVADGRLWVQLDLEQVVVLA